MSNLSECLQAVLSNDNEETLHDGGNWYSNHDMQADVQRIMNIFALFDVKPQDRIIVGYPNSYAFVATFLACIQYGAIIVPINPNMPVPELYRFIVRSNARTAFFTERQWEELSVDSRFRQEQEVDKNKLQLDNVFTIVSGQAAVLPMMYFRKDGKMASLSLDHLSANLDKTDLGDERSHDAPSDDAIAVILYTSGTTGKPKAVGLQHKHLLATANNVIASHQLTQEDTTYCFLPLFHINAQVVALLSTLLSRGRIILAEKFSVSKFWPVVTEHRVTWVSAVPTIIAILLNTPSPNEIPNSLRFIRSASAQLPQLHAKRFESKFGIPIIQSYGMTEAASQICVNPLPPQERRLGSVGLPVGVQLKITDESGQTVNAMQVGEIAIKGDCVIDYYEEAESQKDFRDGWFFTGDLGYTDTDGYVYITGRVKEMINRAGEKISPYEVEDILRQYPGVAQVAVIGLPDAMYGERVAAYVTLQEDSADEKIVDKLKEHCQSSISIYKCPSEIHIARSIPTGATGKIQRTALKSKVLSASNFG